MDFVKVAALIGTKLEGRRNARYVEPHSLKASLIIRFFSF